MSNNQPEHALRSHFSAQRGCFGSLEVQLQYTFLVLSLGADPILAPTEIPPEPFLDPRDNVK